MTYMRRLRTKAQEHEQREHKKRLVWLARHNGLYDLNWLNEGTSKSRSRVARLIELLKFGEQRNREWVHTRDSISEFSAERRAIQSQMSDAQRGINEILARYRGSRRVYFLDDGPIESFWEATWDRALSDDSYAAEISLISFSLSLLRDG